MRQTYKQGTKQSHDIERYYILDNLFVEKVASSKVRFRMIRERDGGHGETPDALPCEH